MKLGLTLLFCSCCTFLVAQTDSSWINLGRIRLKKDFTQTVTIKGKDLEQMPFSTLDEALNVWFSGLLTTKNSVVYVVDGSLLTDVHAYSIHDIEEVTLVQNAAVNLNGALHNQLVLITTKNKTAPSGFSVAGATYAVSNKYRSIKKSETNLVHRLDVAARRHTEKLAYGGSLGYMRDVFPYPKKEVGVNDAFQVNRFRVHGYLNFALNTRNNIWARAGYVPAVQKADMKDVSFGSGTYQFKNKESLFSFEGGWNTQITTRLHNDLSVGYSPARLDGNSKFPGTVGSSETRFRNLLLNDHLNYHIQQGNWSIDPAMDLTYRRTYSKLVNRSLETSGGGGLGSPANFQENIFKSEYKSFLVTPSVNLEFKNIFSIQAGLVYNPSDNEDYAPESKKILPFVTTAFDVAKAIKPASTVSWKLFGSYAAAGRFADYYYPLSSVTGYMHPTAWTWPYYGGFMPRYGGGDTANYSWQVGTGLSIWNNRLNFSYNYKNDKYDTLYYFISPYPGFPVFIPATVKTSMHRIGVTAKIFQNSRLNWSTGINATSFKADNERPNFTSSANPSKIIWSGGWVNRLQYGSFTAGLDLLYVFNQPQFNGSIRFDYADALSLHNVYVGYQFKTFDLFIESRNLFQGDEAKMPDTRTFYGAGFKAAL